MDTDPTALVVAGICLLILAAAFLVMFGAKSERDIVARMHDQPVGAAAPGSGAGRPRRVRRPGGLPTSLGERLRHRALLSEKDLLNLERSVAAAGFNPRAGRCRSSSA